MRKTHPGDGPSPARPPRREHCPDLSPQATFSRTNPPTVAADRALWDAWADAPLEQMGLFLLDEHGNHVFKSRKGE